MGEVLTRAISAEMVVLYAEVYGHDRTTARTYINDNVVVCILEKDIGEKNNLADEERKIVADLTAAWDTWNKRNIAPLWHGGVTEDPTAPSPKKEPKK